MFRPFLDSLRRHGVPASLREYLDLLAGLRAGLSDWTPEGFYHLARATLVAGGTAPAVLNAANEVAVSAFLQGRIRFLAIPALVEHVLAALPADAADSLDVLRDADAQARRLAGEAIDSGVVA